MAKRHQTLIPLSHDHHHALALAIRCRKQALGQLNPRDPYAAKGLALEIKKFFLNNLTPHFEAEEKVLFPLIQSHARDDSETLITNLLSDHERIRKTVTRLEEESELSKALFNLGDLLDHHVRQEERVLFPIFEKTVPHTSAEQAGQQIKRILQATAKTSKGR